MSQAADGCEQYQVNPLPTRFQGVCQWESLVAGGAWWEDEVTAVTSQVPYLLVTMGRLYLSVENFSSDQAVLSL